VGEQQVPNRGGFVDEMRATGLPVSEWSNGPGDTYAPHQHEYRKILHCLDGSIVFHLPDRDVELAAGDRMDLEPGVVHSATVGPAGVVCAEAHIR
jgi:quercetin dioxygenase-like cupin family protein